MQSEYELVLVLSPKATESDAKKIEELVKTQLTKEEKVLSFLPLGKKQLAYIIKKEKEAHFWVMTLTGIGTSPKGVTSKLHLNDLVLRHLLVKKEK